MNLPETAKIIKKILYSYPNAFKNLDLETAINIWHEELQYYDYQKTMDITSEFVRNNRFAPSLADICVYKEQNALLSGVMEDY